MRRVAALLLSGLLMAVVPALAQETRADEVAARQAEKAKALKPYEPSAAERWSKAAEASFVQPPRVYAFFGSVFPGGLLAVGPGVRQPVGDTALLDVHAGWSLRNFKLLDTSYRLPALANRRVRATVYGRWIDAPSVDFYGVGNGSSVDDRATFLYRPRTAGARVEVRPVAVVSAGGGVEYFGTRTEAGARGTSVEDRFASAQLAGFGTDLNYVRSFAFAAVDWRDSPGYSRRGGLWRVDWSNHAAQADKPFSFRRVDAEARQFIPLLRANWVILLGAEASFTQTDAGHQVPFYLLPALGGSGALPGYPSWRFRDRNRLLLGGEFRWTPGHYVDMALFYQAGRVAARRQDLDLDHMKDTYGIGIRFHTAAATVLRADLARTREGVGVVLAFSQGF